MIVRSRATEVVLKKKAKYRLLLSRFTPSFRKSFLSLSMMYCALLTLPYNPPPPLRRPYQPFMFPTLVNLSSSPAYTSRYISYAVCMTSLSVLHAFRNAQKAELPTKAPHTTIRASSLSVQASANSACIALPSNNPDRREYRIWPGITFYTDRRTSVLVKCAAFLPTIPPILACAK